MTQDELRKALIEAADLLVKTADVKKGVDQAAATLEKTVYSVSSGTFAQREHLDREIRDVTNRKTPFLDMVSKVQANGLTHEWDMVTAIGTTDTAVAECGTPPVNESTISRYSAQIKTFATRVEVCDRAQWGASDYFDLMNLHLERGMRKIVQDVEKKSFYGDATTAAAEFSGLYKLITTLSPAGNVIDAAGASITQEMIDNAIQAIVDQGGMPTHIFMSAKDLRDFAALWANKVVYNDPSAGMTFGYNVARYLSFAGPIDLVLDPWITGALSPNNPNTDAFVVDMSEIALAQSEPMYKLPTYRGLTLAETQSVVWNVVLELRVPHWSAVIKDLG